MTPLRDTYVTRRYKTGWIHTCHNRTTGQGETRVQFQDGRSMPVKSVRAAELQINATSK